MLGVGATTLVSHAAGRKDRDRANVVFSQAQGLSMAAGIAFLVVTLAGSGGFARAMSADEGTARLAIECWPWMVPAMALQFLMVAMGAALRGTGNFKPGMIVQTATVIINIILAPILIFGWGMGLPWAWPAPRSASFLAILFGVAWLTTYFVGTDAYLTFMPHHWKRLKLWGEMLTIACVRCRVR